MDTQLPAHLQGKIPANKFYPPRLTDNQLVRERLLDALNTFAGDKKLVVFNGQAGQGKTTLAAQYLESQQSGFCWYQLGNEDEDAILFIASLMFSLARHVPGFAAPILEEMVRKAELEEDGLYEYANFLLHGLSETVGDTFYWVFDDVHLLTAKGKTASLLSHLIESSPPNIHFLLLSRHQMCDALETLIARVPSFVIRNRDLSFTRAEVSQLLQDVLKLDCDLEAITQIASFTEGWISGLILVAQSLLREGRWDGISNQVRSAVDISQFFKEQIIRYIPPHNLEALMQLSFIDVLDVDIASQLTNNPEISQILSELVANNLFTVSTDLRDKNFRFHHLFRDALQQEAKRRWSAEHIAKIQYAAAELYLQADKPQAAMDCFIEAGDLAAADRVMGQVGPEIMTSHRHALEEKLSQVPFANVQAYPWICSFLGSMHWMRQPHKALDYLLAAYAGFQRNDIPVGELLVATQLINFHGSIDGRYEQGGALLERGEVLFPQVFEQLTPHAQVHVCVFLGSAHTILHSDIEKAREYFQRGMRVAHTEGLENLKALVQTHFCIGLIFSGRLNAAMAEAEALDFALVNPRVSRFTKLLILLFQAELMVLQGDDANYRRHVAELERTFGRGALNRCIAGPMLLKWDCDRAVATGDWNRVGDNIDVAMAMGDAAVNGHIVSLFKQYQALLLAKRKEPKARVLMREAASIRSEQGSFHYRAYQQLFDVLLSILVDDFPEARGKLDALLPEVRRENKIDSLAMATYFDALIAFHLKEEGLQTRLGRWLETWRENKIFYGFGWVNSFAEPLLQKAICESIETRFAEELLIARCDKEVDAQGELIPRLHIQALGELSFAIDGRTLLRAGDLSPIQRQFLMLLLASPSCTLDQGKVQLSLWPDSEADKARNNFDTFMSRMRKLFKQHFADIPVDRYFTLKKGIVRFQHIRLDLHEFRAAVAEGFAAYDRGQYWQAANAYFRAFSLWGIPFTAEHDDEGEVDVVQLQTTQLFVKMCRQYAAICLERHRYEMATEILYQAWAVDKAQSNIAQQLYQLYVDQSEVRKAADLLAQYKQAMVQLELDPEDIEAAIDDIKDLMKIEPVGLQSTRPASGLRY